MTTQQQFGGDWTDKKLESLRKYLCAYMSIMKKRKYKVIYVDAFAGTGYRTIKSNERATLLLPELAEEDPQRYIDGSVRIALQIEPNFDQYIFIDNDEAKISELVKIRDEYSDISDRIQIENTDANNYIIDFCENQNWNSNRAVIFLDPFAMHVTWTTIEAIARTQAIDLWLLFPLMAVNRLLKRDGNIDESWREKLDALFGESL